MMRFQDFRIEISDPGGWFADPISENVDETLLRINNWIEENEHIILNIESLFIPELNNARKGTGAAYFKDTGGHGSSTKYFQIFRVWYQENKPITNTSLDDLV